MNYRMIARVLGLILLCLAGLLLLSVLGLVTFRKKEIR